MGKEWKKWKSWSRNAYHMEMEWRVDFQKAHNMTRGNGTGGGDDMDGPLFDWEKWEVRAVEG